MQYLVINTTTNEGVVINEDQMPVYAISNDWKGAKYFILDTNSLVQVFPKFTIDKNK